jgi:hypothetical protein
VEPRAVPRVEPVGDDVVGLADPDLPGDGVQPLPVGRTGTTGRSSGASPPTVSSRTHASTPSS